MNLSVGNKYRWQWSLVSVSLLLIYLAFFHLCLESSYYVCNFLGVGCWLLWCGVCCFWSDVFLNRFEYWIHHLVGIDILLEGFSPLHEGYGFYVCASCFWSVFLIYRMVGNRKVDADSLRPEFADNWVGSGS